MDLPEVGPTDVGVRTVFSGISQGTERWLLTNRYRWTGGVAQYPHFPGYQAAGVVDRVGSDVKDLHVGDHAFVQGTSFIGPTPGYGLASHSGYLVAPRTEITRLEPSVELGAASLLRMAGVGRHGVRLTG